MRKLKLYALMITTALLALVAVVWSFLKLFVFSLGPCGFIWPEGYALLLTLIAPVAALFIALKVFRYCFHQLPFSSLR
jgi:hypothetical protein